MAARVNKIRHDEETRNKIKAANIINRLSAYVLGEEDPVTKKPVEMVPAQVTAALGLLKKVVPDLTSVEHSGEIQKTYVARLPARVGSVEKWQQTYAAPTTTTTQ